MSYTRRGLRFHERNEFLRLEIERRRERRHRGKGTAGEGSVAEFQLIDEREIDARFEGIAPLVESDDLPRDSE